jgi:hypothetical protein
MIATSATSQNWKKKPCFKETLELPTQGYFLKGFCDVAKVPTIQKLI